MDENASNSYPLAYLITLRTYGTWLHGEEKGSVDRHGFNSYGTPRIHPSRDLKGYMQERSKSSPFNFDKAQRICVLKTVKEVCEHRGYDLLAINIRTNHVHAVISSFNKPDKIANDIKAYATRRLRENGLVEADRTVWARGRSRRYLWTERHIEIAIDYVLFGQGGEIPEFD